MMTALETLAAQGWTVFELPGTEISDHSSFFDAVRRSLPLSPPLLGDASWDALSDSIWGGLDELEADRIAIVWRETRQLMEGDRSAYEVAVEVLQGISDTIADPEFTAGEPKQVVVVLQQPVGRAV